MSLSVPGPGERRERTDKEEYVTVCAWSEIEKRERKQIRQTQSWAK